MSLHQEIHLENEICDHLAAHGWLYEGGDASLYERDKALYAPDVLAWVQAAQPEAWKQLEKAHGQGAGEVLLARLRDQLAKRSTLEVLRDGVDVMGLRSRLKLAQFKPAMGLNPEIVARYGENRLRVVRQVRYSLQNENAIDLVLFLNGLPVATAELKTDFTQAVENAVDQYRYDRVPQPKGQAAEPLLSFGRGALVHFAVSNSEVRMTTRLAGKDTVFLPFNRGNDGGAGNPVNAQGGHATAYLWEEVWERESWLEILGRFLVAKRDASGKLTDVVFPRYHQLDVPRKLEEAVLNDGPGRRYLVQHSAGSGKTKSIAWAAHLFADLHGKENDKLFDSVVVVSDRNVIDGQLKKEIGSFARTPGVVESIGDKESSKSDKLAKALSGDKKIVVCTIQTFPFALQKVRELAATQGKRFAVIADEAHSSQTGEAAAKLKAVLSPEEAAELDDGGEVSTEDVLAAQMAARAEDSGITFVAFTATPKAKTIELFGTRPKPDQKPGKNNVPRPFHVYSMQQAIEEGFILDVLANYTPYSLAFKLAHEGKELAEAEVERSAALKKIMGWVRLHPYNIAQKVEVVVEHYRSHVAPLLDGRAKAMVVVSSRVEAVRWKLAMEKYIQGRGYDIGALVAFSGEVRDEESGPDPFTEASPALNPKLKQRDLAKAFEGSEYQVLLVANKFQTGFDQPLLCGMYVDERLAGIQAVQTLSRLNRAHPGKDTTYVVDFVNQPDEVLAAFKTYYRAAELSGTTDPNLVYDLRAKLDVAGHYDDFEVDRVVKVELDSKSKKSDLGAAIDPVRERVMKRCRASLDRLEVALAEGDAERMKEAKAELEAIQLFKGDMGAYLRLYTFLSQIFDYGSTDIEKRAIFYKRLLPLLELGRERESIDLSKVKLTHHALKRREPAVMNLRDGAAPRLEPIGESGGGSVQEKQRAKMREIIEKLNALFGSATGDEDQLVYVGEVSFRKLLASDTLVQQAANNTKEQFSGSPDLPNELLEAILSALDAHNAMSTQALNSKEVQAGLLRILLGPLGLYEALRKRAA